MTTPRLHIMGGGLDALFALGVERRGWIVRVPGTETNDYRLAKAWLRQASAALGAKPAAEAASLNIKTMEKRA